MHGFNRKWVAGVAAVCALGLIAASCSKDDSSDADKGISKSENQKNSEAAKALPSSDINTASRSQLKDGGSVNIPTDNYPANFNLAELDGNTTGAALSLEPTVAEFFTFNDKGDPVMNKDYLESAKVTSQKPFTVELKLNPKAVWSDGTPMGYADFLGNWKALSGKNTKYNAASHNGFELMTSVTKGIDDRDIIVKFSRPYGDWYQLFDGLLPRSLTASPAEFNNGWKNNAPISGGPFVVAKADSTAQIVTLKPNPKWWGDKPKLSEINMRALDLNATTGAFKNGEIDIVNAGVDVNTLRAAESVKGTKILRATSAGWHLIDLNAKSPFLKDPKMRYAISMAIPRDQIAKIRQSPFGAPATLLNNHILGVTQQGYQDNATKVIGPDPDKAKSMLADLGWKKDGQYLKKDGQVLTLNMPIPSDTSSQTDVSQILQKTLGALGVKVNIQSSSVNSWFDKINGSQFDIAYQGWTGGVFPECQMKSIFWPAISEQNKTGASSKKVGDLFDEACATVDQAKRISLINELDQELFKIDTTLPLFNDPGIAATKSDLANVAIYTSAFGSTRWQDVGWIK